MKNDNIEDYLLTRMTSMPEVSSSVAKPRYVQPTHLDTGLSDCLSFPNVLGPIDRP